MTMLPPPLPTHLDQRRPDAAARVATEYLDIVTRAIVEHPRSQQTQIGPSEIGDPCSRRIGYKLLNTAEKDQAPNWKATIGTGTHMWLETAFDADNTKINTSMPLGQERWLIETRVNVGTIDGLGDITGSCDLYDRWTGTVIDHKTVGPTQLTKYRKNGPGQQYRTQAHLYGRGWQRAGLPVDHVMIAFLPRNGELADAYMWSEPYDEQVAVDGLNRLAGIHLATTALGTAALGHLPTVEAYCSFCPFFRPGSTDLAAGCPGDDTVIDQMATNQHQQLAGLVG
ncbi:hypothetical protein ACQBAU_16185 [Propionibacteriaceae bacterium Y2011]